jgi:hypothetical protein
MRDLLIFISFFPFLTELNRLHRTLSVILYIALEISPLSGLLEIIPADKS